LQNEKPTSPVAGGSLGFDSIRNLLQGTHPLVAAQTAAAQTHSGGVIEDHEIEFLKISFGSS
jgi:hypothetical protein